MRHSGIGNGYPEAIGLEGYEEDDEGRYVSPVCICDFCGEGIYSGQPALRVLSTRDIIHASCWEDYSQDNQCCLTKEYDTSGGDE
ncbi:MAG: hypothetical protein AB9835_12805 [Eubacteriales bacterium]